MALFLTFDCVSADSDVHKYAMVHATEMLVAMAGRPQPTGRHSPRKDQTLQDKNLEIQTNQAHPPPKNPLFAKWQMFLFFCKAPLYHN